MRNEVPVYLRDVGRAVAVLQAEEGAVLALQQRPQHVVEGPDRVVALEVPQQVVHVAQVVHVGLM